MKMNQSINKIYDHQPINVLPGVRGQRAFPTSSIYQLDPFVMLDHIGPETLPETFKVDGHSHPHRGFETITFMFEGNMNHVDSLGIQAHLGNGSVQVMNAGRGVTHGGDMWADKKTNRFHEIQLWVNSPRNQKMSEPRVNTFDSEQIPVYQQWNSKEQKATVRVIAGNAFDKQGPVKTFAEISALHGITNGVHEVSLPVPSDHETVFLYVMAGTVTVGKEVICPYSTASFKKETNEISLLADHAEFLLLSGKPLNEPVVMGGPFVMNTKEEIKQAIKDYQEGNF